MKKTLMLAPLMGVVMLGSAQTTNPSTTPTGTNRTTTTTTTNSSTNRNSTTTTPTRSTDAMSNRMDTVPGSTTRPMNNTNRSNNSGNMGNRRDTMGMRNGNMTNQRSNSTVTMRDTMGRGNMNNGGNVNTTGTVNNSSTTDGSMSNMNMGNDMSGGQMNSSSRWEAMGIKAGSLPRKDLKFVALAASSNSLELKASQLAMQNASSQAVKDYASMMIQHHTQAAADMNTMLTSKGAVLPDSFMLERHRGRVEALANMRGADFDRAYVRLMVDAHEEDVDEFEDETTDARDADLRAFATKMMPTLRMHYTRAKELRKSMR